MSKAPPPLLGFNNNVRHRGRIFHIQTEDSGIKTPRIVTHLFADGGRIVKTTRTDYSAQVGTPDMAALVRGMMKEQHKAMFAALRAGELDALLEQVCGLLEEQKSEPSSVKLAAPVPTVVVQGVEQSAPVVQAAPAESTETAERIERPSERVKRRARTLSNPNLRKAVPSVAPPAGFDLDVAALDKLPPKTSRSGEIPAVAVGDEVASAPAAAPASARQSNPPRKARQSSLPPKPKQKPPPLPAKRSAAARNGLQPPPPPSRNSLFGDGLSEKSLDEVILSYLAEDLDPPGD